jgi:dTDP-glucose pyrophosphorylase
MVDSSETLAASSVRAGATLRDAMWALDRGNLQIALVCDANEHLVGILTDGDIRRALLGGATLETPLDPYVRRDFVSVDPSASRTEVIELMQARMISQIPIVSAAGCLVGMHLLHEMIGRGERENWAVIMAGGEGKRLLPLTETVPKPMLKVAGRPILERIVLHLVGFGIRRVFLAVNYLSDVIEQHFGDGKRLGCRIDYLREETPLGTGGAISLLPERPRHALLVMNGDLITQFDVGRLLAFHEQGGFALSVGVHRHTYTVPFGVTAVEGERVVSVQEKPTVAWQTNAGIYAIAPSVLERIPRATAFPLPELVDGCLGRGEPVGAFDIEGDWIDVGRASELDRARGKAER